MRKGPADQPDSDSRTERNKLFGIPPFDDLPKIPFDRSLGDPEESEPALPPRSDGDRGA